jgi:hypothetical protein
MPAQRTPDPRPPTADRALIPVLLLLASLLAVALHLTPLLANDFWIQAKVGELIVETGALPRTALFHYTDAAQFPFVAYEWGPSVLFHSVLATVGYSGAIVMKAAFGVLLLLLVFSLGRELNADPLIAIAIAVLTLLTASYRHFLRPELFGLLCLLLELYLIFRARRTRIRGWLLLVAPVLVVWLNSHGSYLVGFALLPLFAVGDEIDAWVRSRTGGPPFELRATLPRMATYGLVFALGGVGVALSPNGLELLQHSLSLSSANYIRLLVPEWLPTLDPSLREQLPPWPLRLFLLHLVIFASVCAVRFRGLRTWSIVWSATLVALSFDAFRHIALYAYGTSAVLASLLATVSLPQPRRRALGLGLAALLSILIGLVVARGNVLGASVGFGPARPLGPGAVRFLREADARGNAFNSYELGDPLAYHFYPDLRIHIDSRIDIYGAKYMRRYARLMTRWPTLEKHLERHDVEWIVLTRRDWADRIEPMREHLEAAGWRRRHVDADVVIWQRARSRSQPPPP